MTEGDLWRSVVGTIHIEGKDGRYWCGFKSTESHQKIENTLDFQQDSISGLCDRCGRNKALSPKPSKALA